MAPSAQFVTDGEENFSAGKMAGETDKQGTPVEVNSALNRLLRKGDISGPDRIAALRRLDVLKAGWREISPSEKVQTLAETLPEQYTLRAMDALQLAAALVWCKEKPTGRVFVCADKRLSEAATNAGFTVAP
jgi:predicted nucleic acid-binding protein